MSQENLNSWKLINTNVNYKKQIYIFVFIFLFLFLFIALMPWQQTASGPGKVIAYAPRDRQQEIHSPLEGRIQKWHIAEGSLVKEGDPIVDLSDNDPDILQRLQQERSALKKRKDSAEQAVETAKINLDRQKLLFEKGLSARRAYELAKLELNRYEVDDANAAAELARIDVRLSRQLTQSVRATAEGQIHRTISGQGNQIVKAGQVIATIVPISESRAVELWVSGNDIPLITLGKKVRLQFEGWPSIQFSGWPSVAIGTFGGVVAVTDLVDSGEGKFRIVVKPDDESWPHPSFLRQGIQARGWVLLSQVTLIYELWRRFNGFPMIAPPDTYKTYREIAKEKKGL